MRRFLLITAVLSTACGGADKTDVNAPSSPEEDVEVKYTAADMVPRAVLDRAELTTAVDEKRFRAAAPVRTQFELSDKIIYFVGKLKRVPTDASIEVRWFLDRDPAPMLVSSVHGSDTFQFVASFSPQEKQFLEGSYSARVFVNDRDVGGVPFVVGRSDPTDSAEVSKIAFSTAVAGAMKPKRPASKFRSGIKRLYVTFFVKGAEPGAAADVFWFRNGESFYSSQVGLDKNRRYGAHVESSGGLPDGEYRVEIHIGPETAACEKVVIGKKTGGPSVDEIAFGLVLKQNNMPKRAVSVFRRDTSVIQCGFRFVDLPPSSTIEVEWLLQERDGDSLLYKNVSSLASGGSGTMGAAWEPGYELAPGDYKAVVSVNGTPLGEESFKVE
jgi:hypothetical protein